MDARISTTGGSRHYRGHHRVAHQAYPAAASPGAAHQQWLAAEKKYLAYIRTLAARGDRAGLRRARCRVEVAERVIPISTGAIAKELHDVHHADQRGDTARFRFVLNELDPAGDEELLRSLYAEQAQIDELCRALEARKATR